MTMDKMDFINQMMFELQWNMLDSIISTAFAADTENKENVLNFFHVFKDNHVEADVCIKAVSALIPDDIFSNPDIKKSDTKKGELIDLSSLFLKKHEENKDDDKDDNKEK